MSEPFLSITISDEAQRMLADAYFSDLCIYREDTGVTDSEVEQALGARRVKGGKSGVAILVMRPSRRVINPDVPGPEHDVEFLVRILEIPTLNRANGGTGKTACAISLRVEWLFHLFDNGLMLFSGSRVEPYNDGSGTVGDDVYLTPRLASIVVPVQVASVLASVDGRTVTLSCATDGAQIVYTTDGSYPRESTLAQPSTAIPYSEPFILESAATLRAAAFAPNKLGSDILQIEIS